MLKDFDTKKLDELIKNKFPIIYDYNFEGIVLLYGGAIRETIMGNEIHDLDILVLTQGKDEILDFITKYKLDYKLNAYNGYKINYKNFEIDMFTTDDLWESARYDLDLLFYDIKEHELIVCGPTKVFDKRIITEINNVKDPLHTYSRRKKKLIKFVKYMSNNNKHVKIKENRIYTTYRRIKRRIILKIKKIKTIIKEGNFRKCLKFLDGCKKEFKLIILLGVLISIILAITPTLSGNLVEKILSSNYKKVIFIIILIIILRVIKIILQFFFSKLYAKIKKTMVLNIRKEVFSNILEFEMTNFNNNTSGSIINKVKDDSNEIARCFNKLKDIMIKGIGNIGVVIYILYLNWIIGIVLIIMMYIIYKVKMIGINKKISAKRKVLEEQEKYASMIGEMLLGIRDIKLLDLKDGYKQLTIESFKEASEIEYDGDNYENTYSKIANLLELITVGLIIIIGMILIKNNMLSPSSLIIIFMYKNNIFSILDRLTILMDTSLMFDLSCTRIFSLLDENKYKKEKYGNNKSNKCNGVIEFKNVTFAYNDNIILNNCLFKTNKHDTIAIIGKSGSGKTTILNLISKMYTPQKGTILIDNKEISELSYEYIKNNISAVSQNPYLFDMSIKDNLKLVKEDITDKEIEDVCKKVYLDKFISSLPDKYDTVIGEGGVNLSQGQKQRLGIARALIKNTPIILLDEITSALDKDTGNSIKKMINNIKKDHTIIMVSHDLSLVEDFKIFILKNGKIKEL